MPILPRSCAGIAAAAHRRPTDQRPLLLMPLLDHVQGSSVLRSGGGGLWSSWSSIVRVDGVRGLYAGLLPSVLKDAPYSAVYLLLYTQSKTALNTLAHRRGEQVQPAAQSQAQPTAQVQVGLAVPFIAALIAASLATTLFHPLEVLKTRLQLVTAAQQQLLLSPSASSSSRMWSLSRCIWQESGWRGFFRGLLPRVLRRSLSNALTWSVYERIYTLWSGRIAVQ